MQLFQAADFCVYLGESIGLSVVSNSNLRYANYLENLILVYFAYNEMSMCRKKCGNSLRITVPRRVGMVSIEL